MIPNSDNDKDFGLLPDEEALLARECLRLGPFPREVVIDRTGTRYQIENKQQAKKLLRLLGIGEDGDGTKYQT